MPFPYSKGLSVLAQAFPSILLVAALAAVVAALTGVTQRWPARRVAYLLLCVLLALGSFCPLDLLVVTRVGDLLQIPAGISVAILAIGSGTMGGTALTGRSMRGLMGLGAAMCLMTSVLLVLLAADGSSVGTISPRSGEATSATVVFAALPALAAVAAGLPSGRRWRRDVLAAAWRHDMRGVGVASVVLAAIVLGATLGSWSLAALATVCAIVHPIFYAIAVDRFHRTNGTHSPLARLLLGTQEPTDSRSEAELLAAAGRLPRQLLDVLAIEWDADSRRRTLCGALAVLALRTTRTDGTVWLSATDADRSLRQALGNLLFSDPRDCEAAIGVESARRKPSTPQ